MAYIVQREMGNEVGLPRLKLLENLVLYLIQNIQRKQ